MKNPGSCFEHQVILETVTNFLFWHTLQSVPELTFSAPPAEFFNSLLGAKLKAEVPAPISSPSARPESDGKRERLPYNLPSCHPWVFSKQPTSTISKNF